MALEKVYYAAFNWVGYGKRLWKNGIYSPYFLYIYSLNNYNYDYFTL